MTMSSIAHGEISHVIDPSNFWIAIGTDLEIKTYASYAKQLNTFYNTKNEDFQLEASSLEKGSEVVVSSNNHWNRAKVARINQDTVDVFYIDLGYTEIINVNQVRFIPHELFNYLPPKVRRMGLAGIRPLSHSWTSRASSYFTDLVWHKDLLVFIVEIDLSQSCGLVLIFTQSEDGTWTSATEKMLEAEMGESSGQHFVKTLSKDLVLSLKEMENICPFEPAQVFNFSEQENNNRTVIDPSEWINSTPHKIPVHVPTQDLQVLNQTKALTVDDIRNVKSKSKKKVSDQENVERKESETDIFDWGNTDLYVGVPDVFTDVHDISKQIAQTFHSDSVGSEIDIFPYRKPKVDDRQDVTKETKALEPLVVEIQDEDDCQQLSEEASYKIGKNLMLILENEDRDEEIGVCQLVNDMIEPDVHIARDYLKVVIETLLEAIVNTRVETQMALTVLDTYIDSELFKDVFLGALKEMKNRYIKLPQSVRLKGRHSDFVQILATVFNHSVNWPKSLSKPVQKYTVNLLKLWILFNKKGQQNTETSLSVELMYLKCVRSFLMSSCHLLLKLSPEHYYNLIDEMKEKLLHDLTHKFVKPLLLELILKYHGASLAQRDIGTQTGEQTEERSCINMAEGDTSEIHITSGLNRFQQNPENQEVNLNPVASEFVLPKVLCSQDLVLSPREDTNTCKASGFSKRLVQERPRLKYTAAELRDLNPLKSSPAQNIIYTQPEEMLQLLKIRKDQRKMLKDTNKQEEGERERFTKKDECLSWKPVVMDTKLETSGEKLKDAREREESKKDESLSWKLEPSWKKFNIPKEREETKKDDSLSWKPVLDTKLEPSGKKFNDTREREETKKDDTLLWKPVLDTKLEPSGKKFNDTREREETKKDDSLLWKPVLDTKLEPSGKKFNDTREREETKKDDSLFWKPVMDTKLEISGEKLNDAREREESKKDESLSWKLEPSWKKFNIPKEREETKKDDSLLWKPVLDTKLEPSGKKFNDTREREETKKDDPLSWKPVVMDTQLETSGKKFNDTREREETKKDNPLSWKPVVMDTKLEPNGKKINDAREREETKKAESQCLREHVSNSSQGATSPEQETCVRQSSVPGKSSLWRIAEDFMTSPSEKKRHSSSSGDQHSCESSFEFEDYRKGPKTASQKKKRSKFQPFKPYLAAQVENKGRDAETVTGDTEEDLLSAEAIAYYEEMENCTNLRDGGEIIHASKLGAASASVSKRQSLFSSLDKPLSSTPHSLWCPEQWRCTRCNSKEHNVYDCPETDGYDSKYMLI